MDNIRDATELLSDMVNALNPADRMVNEYSQENCIASLSEVHEITYPIFGHTRLLKMKLLQSLSAKVVQINKSSWGLSVQQGKFISLRLYKHIFPLCSCTAAFISSEFDV